MKIGYVRVGSKDQKSELQVEQLQKVGCQKIVQEHVAAMSKERPELTALLASLQVGDVVVVAKFDRLGRSLTHLVATINQISSKNAQLISLGDNFDSTTPHGKQMFALFTSLAQFERDLVRERVFAGLSAARSRGRVGGRPKGLSKKAKATAATAENLYNQGQLTVREIAKQLKIAVPTLYRYLRFRGVEIGANGEKRTLLPQLPPENEANATLPTATEEVIKPKRGRKKREA